MGIATKTMWLPEIMRIIPFWRTEWVKFIKPKQLAARLRLGNAYEPLKSRHDKCMEPVCGKRKME